MKVVIAGELPLVEDLSKLCSDAGHETSAYLVETLSDAETARRLAAEAAEADAAIECQNESKAAKRRLVQLLDKSEALYVSALACSATEAASWSAKPSRVTGWAALPPFETGGVVEAAPALQSGPESVERAEAFWAGLGLEVVWVADGPGLVRARILCALINEAATALMDGVAAPDDIDTAMRLGANYPRGPLAWADLLGLEVVLGVMRGQQAEYGEDRYRPCPLLARMVQAGRLGRKAGRGFFEYEGG